MKINIKLTKKQRLVREKVIAYFENHLRVLYNPHSSSFHF
mgnify:CR=1 FL=1